MNRNRKLSRVKKTVVSGLVVTSLIFGNSAFVQAEQVTKEESVYVNAGADGAVTGIMVSDWLKNAGINGTISDKSTLKDIQNVKGEETFEQNGEGLNWSAGSNDIYYQGTTDKELPVSVSLSYRLDGKEISPEELAGKSGKVEIRVKYTNHSSVRKKVNGEQEKMYTPFLMATGVILPTEKFTNVEVDHGRIVNEGSNNIVVGFGVPGMVESLDLSGETAEKFPSEFTVTADVSDFSLGNTITYASASILSDLEVDDDSTLDDLEDDIETLVDSSEELVDGSKTLSDKLGELQDKFGEYADGEKELNKGINDLAAGGNKLAKGVKEYTAGVDSLANGTKDYVNGAKKITDGASQIYDAAKEMPGGYKEFSGGISKYTAGVDEIAEKMKTSGLAQGAASVSAGISELNGNLEKLKESYDSYETIIAGIQAQAGMTEDEGQKQALLAYAEALKKLSTGQKDSVTALAGATSEKSKLKSGASQVSGGIKQVADGISAVAAESSKLRAADGKMTTSIQTLTAKLKELSEGGAKLSKNDKKLLAGAKKILKATKSVKSGSSELIRGAAKLKKGSGKLHSSTAKVTDGITKLGEGAIELKDGMAEFDEKGIQKINEKYEDDFLTLKDRLSALLDISKEYTNFSGIGTGMDGEVKFIIETAAIEKEEEE